MKKHVSEIAEALGIESVLLNIETNMFISEIKVTKDSVVVTYTTENNDEKAE